jgi:hypothetical protein
MLLVVLIMGIVLGMTGSLMGGFFNMFELNEDQSAAKLRANNVFNILSVPLQNAGIGLPSKDIGGYFMIISPDPPIVNWTKPIAIDNSTVSPGTYNTLSGDRMRIVYALPTSVQAKDENRDFSTAGLGIIPEKEIEFSQTLPIGAAYRPYDLTVGGSAVSSFFTFPGMLMLPFHASDSVSGSDTKIKVIGRQPRFSPSPDLAGTNVIRANHEMYLLRAAVAYVDSAGYFVLMEADDKDPSVANTPYPAYPAASTDFYGLRVDGVKAIHFAQDSEGRYITVSVMVEGDSSSTPRPAMKGALEAKWLELSGKALSLTPNVHYEVVSMTYRTRNLQNE